MRKTYLQKSVMANAFNPRGFIPRQLFMIFPYVVKA